MWTIICYIVVAIVTVVLTYLLTKKGIHIINNKYVVLKESNTPIVVSNKYLITIIILMLILILIIGFIAKSVMF